MAVPFSSKIFCHNQRTTQDRSVLARSGSVWFAPAGMTYMALPTNRGIYSAGKATVTNIYAPEPGKNTSNPRLFGKRLVAPKNVRTIFE